MWTKSYDIYAHTMKKQKSCNILQLNGTGEYHGNKHWVSTLINGRERKPGNRQYWTIAHT